MADPTGDLLDQYKATLLRMHDERIETGGVPRRWNRLVNQLQMLYLEIRKTPAGRQAISLLLDDSNLTVREWAACHALAWDPMTATAALELLAAGEGLAAFEARVTLKEFRSGKLILDWVPKGHLNS